MKNKSKAFYFILALIIYGLFFYFVMTRKVGRAISFAPYFDYSSVIIAGWFRTVYISITALLFALVVGLVLYLMDVSKIKLLHYLAAIHKNIIYGTPLLVIAIVSYYYIGSAFGVRNKVLVGIMTLALYIGAYVSDIYKGAIEGIHVNQWQTAKMFGFTKYQTYRYVVLPQVMITVLPPLAGQLALTIKGSALLAFMATPEFFNEVNNILAITFRSLEGYLIMAVGYLLITIPLIRLVRYLEVKLNYMTN